ncbi:Asp-tRNA(Asn)/Glu-tRNA(Gln) amidotransferase subunit GatB [Nafulsella turpanensis]|uniref:Asp-tRNA(Asn)/Glu-tRNA(Gln) amidotransferase subunit GatB n=1 Tax=Nafulsella turpanensis TaxID=1265690 RepID=UPI000345A7BC|nr:Asp-tRNA(Asn)/Glu-tRNA(Gln) amidotransferase subunit GatB [Nafulsella turpanensis]
MLNQEIRDKYKVVIGLEVHAQLLTQSKMYASDPVEYGNLPNTNISVITLGHPGTLPVVNKRAVEYAMRMGIACRSEITRYNIFDRKNYFYPDLPKGYQVTQDKTPICRGGFIAIKTKEGGEKQVSLTRIHMEEDSGKSMHLEGDVDTLVDFNRAGTPLIEIVTEPVVESSEEAYVFLQEIRRLVRYLDICDGNMEEGSLRCDANISVMLAGSEVYGKKVEVKNMNSFRNVQRAIEYEIERQILAVEAGEKISSETRTFDATTGTTISMRTKEELNDYRYFPEPDLSPLVISDEWLNSVKEQMPSLPWELLHKFVNEYGLSEYDAQVLTDSKNIALYFEELCSQTRNYKAAANWMMGPVKGYLNELTLDITNFPLKPAQVAELIELVDSNKVSFSVASQKLYPLLLQQPQQKAIAIAEAENLLQESNEDTILPIIEDVIAAWPEKVEEYRGGKKGLLGLFMGEVMKKSQGKADPKKTNQLLREALEK